jgi:hypothetical protein
LVSLKGTNGLGLPSSAAQQVPSPSDTKAKTRNLCTLARNRCTLRTFYFDFRTITIAKIFCRGPTDNFHGLRQFTARQSTAHGNSGISAIAAKIFGSRNNWVLTTSRDAAKTSISEHFGTFRSTAPNRERIEQVRNLRTVYWTAPRH